MKQRFGPMPYEDVRWAVSRGVTRNLTNNILLMKGSEEPKRVTDGIRTRKLPPVTGLCIQRMTHYSPRMIVNGSYVIQNGKQNAGRIGSGLSVPPVPPR